MTGRSGSRSRMSGVVDGSQSFGRDLRVHLGRRDAGVPEQLLHDTEIGAALEHVRCTRVPEHVRREVRVEPDPRARAAHDRPARLTADAPAARVEEHRVAVGRAASPRAAQREATVGEIRVQHASRAAADGHDAFLVALAEHAYDAVLEIEVAELEPDRLADADAGRVEHLEQRPVALGQRAAAGDRAEERLDLRFVERLRDPLRDARRVDLLARVGRQQPLGRAEPVERPHRHERPRNRRRREQRVPVVVGERAEVADVVLDGLLADRRRVVEPALAQEGGVAAEIAPVGGAGVRGEAAFDREPVLVLGEETGELIGRRLDRGPHHFGNGHLDGGHVTAAVPPPLGRPSPGRWPRSGSAGAAPGPRPAGGPLRRTPRTTGAAGSGGS